MFSSRSVLHGLSLILILAMVAGLGVLPAQAQSGGPGGHGPSSTVRDTANQAVIQLDQPIDPLAKQQVKVVIELEDQPAVIAYASRLQVSVQQAEAAARSQMDRVMQAQAEVRSALVSPEIGAQEIYAVQRVYNGIAVQVEASRLGEIEKLPGVKAVHPLISKTVDNASSAALIGAPQVWKLAGGTGEGIRVGIIDTGIDYTHANFGGPGTVLAYTDNKPNTIEVGTFPTVKVVGGYDFVGNTYNGGTVTTPTPDPDPLDCYGHGSHVAGTVGGYGVTSAGATYTGPYNDTLDLNAMRIGPGIAPKVSLFALKIFGCSGSTDFTDEAIEWAVDPNQDGSFSDHLDVINLSLGSPYGSKEDSSSVALDNAAKAGVIVVASAGNDGDVNYIVGSPSVATYAISVAASMDAGQVMDGFEVISAPSSLSTGVYPSSNSVAYSWATQPDVQGQLVYPTSNQGGCLAFTPGTFTGKVALLDWTHNPDGTNVCGSTTRVTNAYNAGAIGVILAYDLPIFDISISGASQIPATITTLAVGNLLKTALPQGAVTVKLTDLYTGSVENVDNSVADMMTSFSSRGPRSDDSFLKPDITAPGASIFSTGMGSGNNGASYDGTSMAAPEVAGVMALMRKLHPTWTVEELKALVMNTANHSLYTGQSLSGLEYGPARVGSGRVDAQRASSAGVILYNIDDPGAVSVSFGAPEVVTSYAKVKNVRLVNKTTTSKTVKLSYRAVVDMPGVSITLQTSAGGVLPSSISLTGGASYAFRVVLSATEVDMLHNYDPTLSNLGLRNWLGEEGGYIQALVGSDPVPLRLAVYATPRLASQMSTSPGTVQLLDTSGEFWITASGKDVFVWESSGIGPIQDVYSMATLLELVDLDSRDLPAGSVGSGADIHAVGIMSDFANPASDQTGTPQPIVTFGVSSYGRWSSPNQVTFYIYIDKDQNGTDDYILFNGDLSYYANGEYADNYHSLLYNIATRTIYDQSALYGQDLQSSLYCDMAVFNTGVMTLPLWLNDIQDTDGTFDYAVVSYSTELNATVDVTPTYTYDAESPAIDTTDSWPGVPWWYDIDSAQFNVKYHVASVETAPDVLILHHHNAVGSQVQVFMINAENLVFTPFIKR